MTVEHKTEKGTVRFKLIPNEATCLGLNIEGNCFGYSLNGIPHFIDAKEGEIIICLTSEVTEDQAKMMVDCVMSGKYHNYITKGQFYESLFNTALQSFETLMQHLSVTDGKYIVLFKKTLK